MSAARPQDLACRELVELLTEFLENALEERTRTQVEQHLVLCPGCTEYLRQFRATIGATRKLAEEDLTEAVKEKLLDAFRHWRQGS
ncbi:MAG TPA: anti-sigma factor [Myxococcaceae bacterium]|nr:anti-sigma factor [Myxococcaceae bacterium]